MRTTIMLIFAAVLLVMIGCEDNTTNNYYRSDTGAILGTLSPPDSGIVRATGNDVYETSIDRNGFFFLDNLPPGIYEVTILPANHSRRVMPNQLVSAGVTLTLKQVIISTYPFPIYRVDPADIAKDVDPYRPISLSTDERLDLASLINGSHFQPPIPGGEWLENSATNYSYGVPRGNQPSTRQSGLMRLGTTYHVTIDASVRTNEGIPLGQRFSFSFSTYPLTVLVNPLPQGLSGGVPLWDFRPAVQFAEQVDPDSVVKAIFFEPIIEGVWIPVEYYYVKKSENDVSRLYDLYQFFPTNLPLPPKAEYTMIIGDQVALIDDVHLSRPDTTIFQTEAYGVSLVYPENGQIHVSPDAAIGIEFNATMDTASVESAFSLREGGGQQVEGNFIWSLNSRQITFQHPGALLQNERLYKITVTKAARAASGEPLEKDFVSYFAVQ